MKWILGFLVAVLAWSWWSVSPAGATGLGDLQTNWDTAGAGAADSQGITCDATYCHVVDSTDDEVYRFSYATGGYMGFSWDTATVTTNPRGITCDATYCHLVDITNDEVYRFSYATGGYMGFSWDTAGAGATNPSGISCDATYCYVMENNNEQAYRFNYSDGSYTGTNWDVAISGAGKTAGAVSDIFCDTTYCHVTDNNNNEVYRFNYSDGSYTGTSWDTTEAGAVTPLGISCDATYCHVVDSGNDEVYVFYQAPTSTGSWNTWPPQSFTGYHLVTDTFTVSSTWTAPTGVTSTIAEAWGAGGSGDEDDAGGGGGVYVRGVIPVTAGNTYDVTVGQPGCVPGCSGTSSTFYGDSGMFVFAKPGLGSSSTIQGLGGEGGSAFGSTGDVEYKGGNAWDSGGSGSNNGGGSSAGDTSVGMNGATTGESQSGGQTNGGFGGHPSTNDAVGEVPGGGGKSELSAGQQTAGGRGEVRITYNVPCEEGYPCVHGVTWGRSTSTQAATWTIDLPTSQSGDIIAVFFKTNADNSNTPAGWTLQSNSTGTTVNDKIFYTTSTGAETTLDITTSSTGRRTYFAMAVGNVQGSPITSFATGTTAVVDPPNLSAGASDKYLWVVSSAFRAALATDNNDVTSTSAGYGSYRNMPCQTNGACPQGHMSYRLAEGSSEDPGVFFKTVVSAWTATTIGFAGADAAAPAVPSTQEDVIWFSREDAICREERFARR